MSTNDNTLSLRRSYGSLVNLLEQHRKLDRAMSEPTSRYKTELCRPFEESGSCKYGDKCQFAHGYSELRNLTRHPKYKTELCRTFHKIGFCPYGPRCHFVHNFEEARIQNLKFATAITTEVPLGSDMLLQPLEIETATLFGQLACSLATSRNYGSLINRSSSVDLAKSPMHYHYCQKQPAVHLPYLRENSLGLRNIVQVTKPMLLNLSPTFSHGSAAESISPTSSLSQSPTNSMTSFFSDESTFSPSSSVVLSSVDGPSSTDGLTSFPSQHQEQVCIVKCTSIPPLFNSRTQSPEVESRLPVFNQIRSTVLNNFDNLMI